MKLGIALGGGGAKGFAHLGVLRALTEAGIKFDIVTGTSIGSLVGAVYASGNLESLAEAALQISLKDIPKLMSPAWSRSGFFSGNNALEFLSQFIACEKIENLPIQFASVASDMAKNELVVFTEGDIRKAVRASIAIPVVFTPVYENNRIMVDGGLLEPVPVKLARELGADLVVAVDLFGSYPAVIPESEEESKRGLIPTALNYLSNVPNVFSKDLQSEDENQSNLNIRNIIDVVEATLAISQFQLTQARLKESPADLVIEPDVAGVGLLDFHRGEPIVELGYLAGAAQAQKIIELLA